MASKEVLFVCANANQAQIFDLIGKALAEREIVPKYVHLDMYYDQGAEKVLLKSGVQLAPLPSQICKGTFYRDLSSQGAFFIESIPQIKQLLQSNEFSAVVLGHDIELIEQGFINVAETLGIPTLRIQDGVHMVTPINKSSDTNFPLLPFDGGCDVMTTWNAGMIPELRARGIAGEIHVGGNPRSDKFYNYQREFVPKDRYVGFLTVQPFSVHGKMTHDEEVGHYKRIVGQILVRPDTEVLLKIHPQSVNNSRYYEFESLFPGRCRVIEEGDSFEILCETDFLVTISSTTALEAVSLDVPTIRLKHILSNDESVFRDGERKFAEALNRRDFPKDLLVDMSPKEAYLNSTGFEITGHSAKTISDIIAKSIASRSKEIASKPKASLLLIADDLEVISAFRTATRDPALPLEVVLVDVSQDSSVSDSISELNITHQVQSLKLPGAQVVEALYRGIQLCNTEFVLLLHQWAIALPGWGTSLISTLEKNPEARVAISWFLNRNDLSVSQTHQMPDCNQTPIQFLTSPYASLFYQSCAIKKPAQLRIDSEKEVTERDLLESLFENLNSAEKLEIIPSFLFRAVVNVSSIKQALPEPIAQTPFSN